MTMFLLQLSVKLCYNNLVSNIRPFQQRQFSVSSSNHKDTNRDRHTQKHNTPVEVAMRTHINIRQCF